MLRYIEGNRALHLDTSVVHGHNVERVQISRDINAPNRVAEFLRRRMFREGCDRHMWHIGNVDAKAGREFAFVKRVVESSDLAVTRIWDQKHMASMCVVVPHRSDIRKPKRYG